MNRIYTLNNRLMVHWSPEEKRFRISLEKDGKYDAAQIDVSRDEMVDLMVEVSSTLGWALNLKDPTHTGP